MRAEYGARAIIDLAHRHGRGLTQTADIAARQHIPESYLEQLLTTLRKAGIVRSVRGPAGLLGRALSDRLARSTGEPGYVVTLANSGTEAVMMAIKAARAFTGRDRIAKFEGAYHGYYDDVQVSFSSVPDNWGPGDGPASVPSSGGIPKHRVLETLVLPWNDRDACEQLLTRHRNDLAAVLVDPLSNRMGFIPPASGFLAFLRQVTRAHGILLIYDEVISFRVSYQGAQGRYGGDPKRRPFVVNKEAF